LEFHNLFRDDEPLPGNCWKQCCNYGHIRRPHANANCNGNSNGCSNSNSNGNSCRHGNRYPYGHSNIYTYSNANADTCGNKPDSIRIVWNLRRDSDSFGNSYF
jgi:hypothetical protein